MTAPVRKPLAQTAYEGYAAFTGGKTHDGRDMPTWDALPDRIRDAWAAGLDAALEVVAERATPLLEEIEAKANVMNGAALVHDLDTITNANFLIGRRLEGLTRVLEGELPDTDEDDDDTGE